MSPQSWAVLAGGWWVLSLGIVPFGRPVVTGLREQGLLSLSMVGVSAAFLLAGVAGAVMAARRQHLDGTQLLMAVGVMAAFVGLAQVIERPEERWHLVQYALLGALLGIMCVVTGRGWARAQPRGR